MAAASLYEVHLVQKSDSPNTRLAGLRPLIYLYAWGLEIGCDIDRALLSGTGFSFAEVRAFAAWLRKRWSNRSGVVPRNHRRTHNAIVDECRRTCIWFMQQFALSGISKTRRTINLAQMVATQEAAWKEARHKIVEEEIAGDLTDKEIQEIENLLKPENRARAVGETKAVRDYLIWRMAIELGMRRSEILALRTIDCPSRGSPYFKIVRIEERGPGYIDPREPRAPRPKTLSRDLGFVMRNTRFPKLVSDYITAHRYAAVKRHGRKVRLLMLPHSFLLVSESGKPLSQDYMGKLARQIRATTGIDFHWHLARHAFFNRAYSAVADMGQFSRFRWA